MRESELRDLLERSTDAIVGADLAASALEGARQQRGRRRAAGVVMAVAATVAVAVGVGQLASGGTRSNDPVDTPSTSTSVPVPPPTPSATAGPATQPLWDPFSITEAPWGSMGLPETFVAPSSPGETVASQPMDGVVVAWPQEDADLQLLGTDGGWRTVPGTRDAVEGALYGTVRPIISSDGTRVAMSTNAGILVVDVTTGEETTIPWPDEIAPPWDTAPGLRWLPGDEGFVVLHWRHTWLVDLDGGDRRAPYRGGYVSIGVDPDGMVYQNDYQRRTLITWEGDEAVREVPLYQCERLAAGYGLLACTTGSLEPGRSGPVVVDPATGDVVAYAPIKDRNAVYSDNGHLTALGFLDPETVLLVVGPADFRTGEVGEESWHLVAWEFRTGTFERITSGDSRMQTVAVAPGLLASP